MGFPRLNKAPYYGGTLSWFSPGLGGGIVRQEVESAFHGSPSAICYPMILVVIIVMWSYSLLSYILESYCCLLDM